MSTIEDFENAPVGATATSPDGRQTYRREAKTQGGADWVNDKGEASLWADADGLAHFKYTLGPAPSTAPTTAQEARDLAWDLAHPVKEGQHIPEGTEFLYPMSDGTYMNERIGVEDYRANGSDEKYLRTLDPLPEPEPDWLDAPAVLAAIDDFSWQKVWFPKPDGKWECTCCGYVRHWSEMVDVTPLYPEGKKA